MRAVRISFKHAQTLLSLAREAAAEDMPFSEWHGAMEALEKALALKPAIRERRKVKAAKKATKRDETAEIRALVFIRAQGSCECCYSRFSDSDPGELDHFWGRGKVKQAVTNCWALCRLCHRQKTNNDPGAAFWLGKWISFCDRFGLRSEAWKANARLESLKLIPKTSTPSHQEGA